MMKEVVRALEVGLLPEVGLIAFVLAFIIVGLRAIAMTKQQAEAFRNLPLDEPETGTKRMAPPHTLNGASTH